MNDIALESFRHNSWATRRLLEFCGPLSSTQLGATGVGTFGTIPQTLDHIVRCDGGYARRMAQVSANGAEELSWVRDAPATTDLAQLDRWAAEVGALWERILARPVDVEAVLPVDDGIHQCRVGVFFAQAVNHANHHREQVCAILTGLSIEPPDIQAWEYAWVTRRIWDTAKG